MDFMEPQVHDNSAQMHLRIRTLKIGVLTHYQTTNFRLFQIERLCRRQSTTEIFVDKG